MTDHKPTHRQDVRPYNRSSMYVPTGRHSVPESHSQPKASKTTAVSNLAKQFKARLGGLVRWWKRQDTKYRWKWRAANLGTAFLVLLSVAIPVLSQIQNNHAYTLSADALKLIGRSDPKLASKLSYDSKNKVYEFNKDSVKEFNPVDQLKAQVGTASNEGKDKSLYALDVAQDITKGVTYHDVNSKLSFTMVPQFKGLDGKVEQGRLVYPLANKTQAIYTLKNNGLKEDIVVQKATESTMRFSYTLQLPKTLEARSLPDGSGGIGIYGGNQSLFSNMSYGSDKDKELVEKARENAAKDTLVFGIPRPVITTSKGDDVSKTKARFELKGNQLTVVAEGLDNLNQPFSIDPSVVVPTNTDFSIDGNNESNIAFGSGISRGGLTGGTVGSWTSQTDLPNTPTAPCSNSLDAYGVYNGYVYVIDNANICYSKLNTSGANGAWQKGTALPATNNSKAGFIYNGYFYITGGLGLTGTAGTNATYYIKLNANGGTAANWGTGSTLNTARYFHAATAYNGYAYVSGGATTNAITPTAIVEKATINADGSLGAWSTTTALTVSRQQHMMQAYNGYMYVNGGATSGGTCYNVQYAPINSDGTLGTWVSTTAIPGTAAYGCAKVAYTIYKGYWYASRGANSSAINTLNVVFAPILANGSVGDWQQTTAFVAAQSGTALVAYNDGADDYLFTVGGSTSQAAFSAKINDAGVINSFSSTNADPLVASEGRANAATVAYNGYMYVIGGESYGGPLTRRNTVLYAAINADGSVTGASGTWQTTGGTFTARGGLTAVAYGGYMYIIGGDHGTADTACSDTSNRYCNEVKRAPINTDGTVGTFSGAGPSAASTFFSASGSGGVGGRDGLGSYIYNNRLYVFGGNYNNNSSVSFEVNIGSLNSSGEITSWSIGASMDVSGEGGHSNFGYAGWGNHIYVVGGRTTNPISGVGSKNDRTWIGTIDQSTGAVSWVDSGLDFGTPVAYKAATVSNGYLYITGGATTDSGGGSGVTDTHYSRINNDGSLAGWQALNNFTTARSEHGSVAYNGYLYVVGGCSGFFTLYSCSNQANDLEDVQYAQINNGGSGVTGASTQGSTGDVTGAGHYWAGSAAYSNNGYNVAYNVAGCYGPPSLSTSRLTCGSTSLSTKVMRLPFSGGNMNTDPDISGARFGLSSVAYNGYLYAIGGCAGTNSAGNQTVCTSGNFKSDVQYAPIVGSSGGTIAQSGTTVTGTSTNFSNGQVGATIQYPDGSIAVITAVSNTTSMTVNVSKTVTAGTSYVIKDGAIGSWNSDPDAFTTARYGHSSVVYNGYLYIIGGCSNATVGSGNCSAIQSDVQYGLLCNSTNITVVSSDCFGASAGQVGTWHNGGASNLTARMYFGATAYNGYLYAIGGCTTLSGGVCTASTNSVQSIQLNSDGSLNGDWITQSAVGPPRFGVAVTSYNGYLYVSDGCPSTTASCSNSGDTVNKLYIAPIGSTGYLGSWQSSPNTLSANGLFGHGLVIVGGNLATVRGIHNPNSEINSVYYAPVSTIPRKGLYSKLLDMNSGIYLSNIRGISYSGSLPNGLSDIGFKAAPANGVYGTTGTAASSSFTNARCTGVNGVRYLMLTVAFDDTYSAIYPDANGTASNVSSLNVLYEFSRPPNIRLKLGKTLQQGVQTDLDICKLTS